MTRLEQVAYVRARLNKSGSVFCANLWLGLDSSQIDSNVQLSLFLSLSLLEPKITYSQSGPFEEHVVACSPPSPSTHEKSPPVLLCLSTTWTAATFLATCCLPLIGRGALLAPVRLFPRICSFGFRQRSFGSGEDTRGVRVLRELRQYWRVLRASRQTRFWNPRRPRFDDTCHGSDSRREGRIL